MTQLYIKLKGFLASFIPRVNASVLEEIEATAQFLSVAVPQTVISNSREIGGARDLTNTPLAT